MHSPTDDTSDKGELNSCRGAKRDGRSSGATRARTASSVCTEGTNEPLVTAYTMEPGAVEPHVMLNKRSSYEPLSQVAATPDRPAGQYCGQVKETCVPLVVALNTGPCALLSLPWVGCVSITPVPHEAKTPIMSEYAPLLNPRVQFVAGAKTTNPAAIAAGKCQRARKLEAWPSRTGRIVRKVDVTPVEQVSCTARNRG